jgi:hypothetical protein
MQRGGAPHQGQSPKQIGWLRRGKPSPHAGRQAVTKLVVHSKGADDRIRALMFTSDGNRYDWGISFDNYNQLFQTF